LDKAILKEHRIHGNNLFPLGTYTIEHEAGENILDCHWHDEWEFLLVTAGKATFQIGTAYYPVEKGQGIFVNSGCIHAGYPLENSACTYRAIVFNPNLLCSTSFDPLQIKFIDPFLNGHYALPAFISGKEAGESEALLYLLNILKICEDLPFAYELMVKAQLLLVLASFIKNHTFHTKAIQLAHNRKAQQLKTILSFIHENYSQKINSNEICQQVHINESYFCRFFKQMMRQTPIEYINMYRMNIAAKLLRDNDKKILDIAWSVGFDNLSYFNSVFKKQFLATPSEYRQKKRVTLKN